MRILVIGLDGAVPELLFNDDRLTNLHRLMEGGCYGRLESVIPLTAVPAWMCMATSQDPGSLGVYGCRDRTDRSNSGLTLVDSRSIQATAAWDQVARAGKHTILIGVPPSYPPRQVQGICVGCSLTPNPNQDVYTHPVAVQDHIAQLVGEYPADVKGFRTDRKDWLKNEVYSMSRKHFAVVRSFLQQFEWDYFQFVEIGLDRLQHGFWQFHDAQHRQYTPGNPYEDVIRDYYAYLDEEVGRILELLDDETVVLVVSNHGAQGLDGGFCMNEWLVQEGLLVLNQRPQEITAFGKLDVNWGKTKVWSAGGSCARLFFNVKGREPHGALDTADYEGLCDDLKAKLKALVDNRGQPMRTLVFKPEEVYKMVRNVAPDLIVHFGGLRWRSIGAVGYPTIYAHEVGVTLDGCSHAPFGSFILAAPNNPLHGEIASTHLLDMAPTLLELGGYDIPESMQGRSLVAGETLSSEGDLGYSADEEELVRQRLSGLGYIS